jgi:ribosomal protein S6--L-glutamate ligase
MKRIGVAGIPGAWSTNQLVAAVRDKTGFSHLIDMSHVRLDLETGRAFHGDVDITALDAIIVKKIAPSYSPDALDRMEVLRYLHQNGLPVFSSPDSMIRLIDRLSCTLGLRAGDIPMPPTVITEDPLQAGATVEKYGRAVFKPLYGSKARGMSVIEAGPDMMDHIHDFKAAGNPVMYIQKFVVHSGEDLGVSFLGGEYLATYARVGSDDSWNTTTRAGGRYRAYDPGPEIIELAHRAQALFEGMAFTCVDVVETEAGAQVYEVSAFGGFRGLLEANGVDVADRYVDYVLEQIK